jgi:hypothetical protein
MWLDDDLGLDDLPTHGGCEVYIEQVERLLCKNERLAAVNNCEPHHPHVPSCIFFI